MTDDQFGDWAAPRRAWSPRRATAGALGLIIAVLAAVMVVVLAPRNAHHSASRSTLPTTSSGVPTRDLTAREFALALAVARNEAAQSDVISIASATVTKSAGTVPDANAGPPCLSGTLLNIRLIGDFTIVHGGLAAAPAGPAELGDQKVHGVTVAADAITGEPCLLSVQTGQVTPEDGATVLFTN
jgi:hypothetical protein